MNELQMKKNMELVLNIYPSAYCARVKVSASPTFWWVLRDKAAPVEILGAGTDPFTAWEDAANDIRLGPEIAKFVNECFDAANKGKGK